MTRRLPAEWERHERTAMCWPARDTLWGELRLEAEAAHAAVARAIAAYEPVTMVAAPGAAERAAAACGPTVDVIEIPIDDSWFRDSGPIYVHDDGVTVATSWRFNAWGDKFTPYDDDTLVAERFAAERGDRTVAVDMVLEGGSITSDGEGTIVTTGQCLLHPNRNPTMTAVEIESTFADAFGTTQVVWLPHGLALDDDTDGHVDNVAAFAAPGHLVVQGCADPDEDDWLRLEVNRRTASGWRDAAGRPLHVTSVPVLPFVEVAGERVAVPYLNYYLGNGFVLVPTCGHPADADMLALIGEQHPGRDVVGLDVGAILAYGGGGIHCITQQIPS